MCASQRIASAHLDREELVADHSNDDDDEEERDRVDQQTCPATVRDLDERFLYRLRERLPTAAHLQHKRSAATRSALEQEFDRIRSEFHQGQRSCAWGSTTSVATNTSAAGPDSRQPADVLGLGVEHRRLASTSGNRARALPSRRYPKPSAPMSTAPTNQHISKVFAGVALDSSKSECPQGVEYSSEVLRSPRRATTTDSQSKSTYSSRSRDATAAISQLSPSHTKSRELHNNHDRNNHQNEAQNILGATNEFRRRALFTPLQIRARGSTLCCSPSPSPSTAPSALRCCLLPEISSPRLKKSTEVCVSRYQLHRSLTAPRSQVSR